MKNISILGSTGSIGVSTLEIISQFPDRYRVVALSAGRRLDLLARQVRRFKPEIVSIAVVLPILLCQWSFRPSSVPLDWFQRWLQLSPEKISPWPIRKRW